jgi:hypothetical protein
VVVRADADPKENVMILVPMIQVCPLYEGMLYAARGHHGFVHALLATKDQMEPICAEALGIVFREHGQPCALSTGVGFVAGELLGTLHYQGPDTEPLAIPVKLVLPSTAFLGAYQTGVLCAGSEEGGWHYHAGHLIEAWTVTPGTYLAQRALMQQLIEGEAINADTLLVSYRNVLESWPDERPHYC